MLATDISGEVQLRLREAACAVSVYALLRGIECMLHATQQQRDDSSSSPGSCSASAKAALFAMMRLVVRSSVQWPPPASRSCDDIFRETNEALARGSAAVADDTAISVPLLLSTEVEQCLENLTDFTRHCSGEALITWVTSNNTAGAGSVATAASSPSAATATDNNNNKTLGASSSSEVWRDFSSSVQSMATSNGASKNTATPATARTTTNDDAATTTGQHEQRDSDTASVNIAGSNNVSPSNINSTAANNNSQHPRQRQPQHTTQQYAAAVSTSLEHHAGVVLPFALHLRSSWERAAQERASGGEAVVAMRLQEWARVFWGQFGATAPAFGENNNNNNNTSTAAAAAAAAASGALPRNASSRPSTPVVADAPTSPVAPVPPAPPLGATQANLWRALHLLPTTTDLEKGSSGGARSSSLDTLAPFVARNNNIGGNSLNIHGNIAERRRVHAHAAISALSRARRALLRGEFGIARSSVAIAAAQHAPSCGSTEILLSALTLKMHVEFVTGLAREACQTVGVALDSIVDVLRNASRATTNSGPPVLRPPSVSAMAYLMMVLACTSEALLFTPQAVEESLLRRLLFVLSCVFATDGFSDGAAGGGGGGGNGANGGGAAAQNRGGNNNNNNSSGAPASAATAADASDFVDATLTRYVVDNAAVAPDNSSSSSNNKASSSHSPFAPMATPSIARLIWRRLYHYTEAVAMASFSKQSVAGGKKSKLPPTGQEFRMREAVLCLALVAETRYGDIINGGSLRATLFDEDNNNDVGGQQQQAPPPAGATRQGLSGGSVNQKQQQPINKDDDDDDDADKGQSPRHHDRHDKSTAVSASSSSRWWQTAPAASLPGISSFQCHPPIAMCLLLAEYYRKGPLSAVRAFERLSSVILIDNTAYPLSWVSLQRMVALVCASALQDKGHGRAAAAWLQASVIDRKQQTNKSGFAPAGSVGDDVDAGSYSLLSGGGGNSNSSSGGGAADVQGASAVASAASSMVGAAFWGVEAEVQSQLCMALARTLCWSLESAHLVQSMCLDPLRQQLSSVSSTSPAGGASGGGSGGDGGTNNNNTNDCVDMALATERVKAMQLFAVGRPSLALAALEQAASTCLALGYDMKVCEIVAEAYVGAASYGDWESAAAWRNGLLTAAVSSNSSSSSSASLLRVRGPWRSFLCRLSLRKLCDVLLAATMMVAAPVAEHAAESASSSSSSVDAELAAAEATVLWEEAATVAPGLFAEACSAVATAISSRLVPSLGAFEKQQQQQKPSFFHSAAATHLREQGRSSNSSKKTSVTLLADAVPLASTISWMSSVMSLFDPSATTTSAPASTRFSNMLWNAIFPATPHGDGRSISEQDVDALESVFDALMAEMNGRRDSTASPSTSDDVNLDTIVQSSMVEQARFVLKMK